MLNRKNLKFEMKMRKKPHARAAPGKNQHNARAEYRDATDRRVYIGTNERAERRVDSGPNEK